MSHTTPINYIFIDGPDCSGKTTLFEMIHKASGYKWNIQDRSALSMLIHARYYGRNTFNHVEQLTRELYNLNNQLIICLPDWSVIVKRFAKRGDDGKMLTYEKEKDYYERIEDAMFKTIKSELNGDNPYGRKEDLHSRRFIYADDSCIATCHFLIRDRHMDARFYLRSSNVKDTIHYDLNFLKHLTACVFRHFKCDREGYYCKLDFTIGSGHIILDK